MLKGIGIKILLIICTLLSAKTAINGQDIYFPLHEGNAWHTIYYSESYFGETCKYRLNNITVQGDTVIEGKRYFILLNDEIRLWRYDTLEQKLYNFNDDTEMLFMDFGLGNGEKFYQGNREVTVVVKNVSVNSGYVHCKGYRYSDQSRTSTQLFAKERGFINTYCTFNEPTGYYRENIYESKVYIDTGFVYGENSQKAQVLHFNPPDTISIELFTDTLTVNSEGNRICTSSILGTSIINYVNAVEIEGFYYDGISKITIETLAAENIEETFDWRFSIALQSQYLFSGFTFYYRIKITENNIIPREVYFPATEYLTLQYNQQILVNAMNENKINHTLYQNFPNPFNPSTTISYNLTAETFVEMEVIDILGNSVDCLVNKLMPAGKYKVIFNAGDLSSGIYFCRMILRQNNKIVYSKATKMLYLK